MQWSVDPFSIECNSQWDVCSTVPTYGGTTHTHTAQPFALLSTYSVFIYLLPLLRYLWINFHCYYGKTTICKQRCAKLKLEEFRKIGTKCAYTLKLLPEPCVFSNMEVALFHQSLRLWVIKGSVSFLNCEAVGHERERERRREKGKKGE